MLFRTLTTSAGEAVTIEVSQPYRLEEDWFTDWTIDGLEPDRIEVSTGGVDPMQSMILALAGIGDRVNFSGVKLSFNEGDSLQLLSTALLF